MNLLITTQRLNKDDPILGFFHRWVEEFTKRFDRIDVICFEGTTDLPNVYIHELGEGKLTRLFNFYKYYIKYAPKNGEVFHHMGDLFPLLASPFWLFSFNTEVRWWKAHGDLNWKGKIAYLFVDEVLTSTAHGFRYNDGRRIIGQAIDTDLFTLSNKPRGNHALFVGRDSPVKRINHAIYWAWHFGQELKVAEGITQPELVEKYQTAEKLIHTSETGSLDKVVLEALACGCPVFATGEVYKTLKLEGTPEELREQVVKNHSIHTLVKRIWG